MKHLTELMNYNPSAKEVEKWCSDLQGSMEESARKAYEIAELARNSKPRIRVKAWREPHRYTCVMDDNYEGHILQDWIPESYLKKHEIEILPNLEFSV